MNVNDRVKVINQEIYGTIIYDYGKEVIIIDEDAETEYKILPDDMSDVITYDL